MAAPVHAKHTLSGAHQLFVRFQMETEAAHGFESVGALLFSQQQLALAVVADAQR